MYLKTLFSHILIASPNEHTNIKFCLLIIRNRDSFKHFLESLCSPALGLEWVTCHCGFGGICSITHVELLMLVMDLHLILLFKSGMTAIIS